MANSALTSLDSVPPTRAEAAVKASAKTLRRSEARALAAVMPGESATILSLDLEDDLVAWLQAVGIGCGDRVTVLRRAALGGPIHVRTAAGGEFAIARSLACAILTAPVTSDRAYPDPSRALEPG